MHTCLEECWISFKHVGCNFLFSFIVCAMGTQSLSHVQLFATQWTAACQAPLSMGFSRQAYKSGLPFPPLGDLHNPGMGLLSPVSPTLQADSLPWSL